MSLKINTAARNNAANFIADQVDVDGPGSLELRSGVQPASTISPDSGTLLAVFELDPVAFNDADNGTINSNPIAPTEALANGDAGHFRVKDGNGVTVFQGTAGEASEAPDLEINDKTIVLGSIIEIGSAVIVMPAG